MGFKYVKKIDIRTGQSVYISSEPCLTTPNGKVHFTKVIHGISRIVSPENLKYFVDPSVYNELACKVLYGL